MVVVLNFHHRLLPIVTYSTKNNMSQADQWIANRTRNFDSSGIRKMFDLAANLEDPVNLSIGQPDFAVPRPVKDAYILSLIHI